ncbi:DUF6640 family protein [Erythrobacter sp.]|uniref:DUF6640 family protein n=1 Tax=Erythrobacter sp. TaxID=1042 RepID=UPI001425CFEF|nr:DUF6640 family protein [Erythrobacter sp.]QIQ85657.1 MAG: hypothetical protein G9473_02370 [Erythrobacter sp.]
MLLARLLLTATALGFGLAPFVTDLSMSHAFNPDWPAHARFHTVWLVLVLAALALVMLVMTWRGKPADARANLAVAAAIGWTALAPFGLAALAMPAYGGALAGREHEILVFGVNSNLIGFGVGAAMLAAATWLVMRRN